MREIADARWSLESQMFLLSAAVWVELIKCMQTAGLDAKSLSLSERESGRLVLR